MSSYSYVLDAKGQNRPDVVQRDDGVLCFLVTNDSDGQGAQAWLAAGNVPSPAPRVASIGALIDALSDAQWNLIAPRDRARLVLRDDVPVTSSKVARAAKALGMTPDALFALAGA